MWLGGHHVDVFSLVQWLGGHHVQMSHNSFEHRKHTFTWSPHEAHVVLNHPWGCCKFLNHTPGVWNLLRPLSVTWMRHVWDLSETLVTWVRHVWREWDTCDVSEACVTWMRHVWPEWDMCDVSEWDVCDMSETIMCDMCETQSPVRLLSVTLN